MGEGIEAKAKTLLLNIINDQVTDHDRKVWHEDGHFILHWLRTKLTEEVFE